MDALMQLVKLWRHCAWADAAVLGALRDAPGAAAAWREYAHVLGAEAVWLARLRGEPARTPVWPALAPEQVGALGEEVRTGFDAYLARLGPADVGQHVAYANSAGRAFGGEVGDILLHVMLHGQYHRGKVNLLLRQSGAAPAPTDYIAYVRGTPAASAPVPPLGTGALPSTAA